MNVIQFIDDNIKLNEKSEPWSLALHQRDILALMFSREQRTRLWSEIKKSGKTFLAGCVGIYEAVTHANCEVVCVANDEEQAQSRVFATAVDLCRNNPELSASVVKTTQNEIRFSNNSVIKAIASDYKGAAGGRQRLTIFDELWAYDLERMTRLFEEMRPPPTEPGAYIFIELCGLCRRVHGIGEALPAGPQGKEDIAPLRGARRLWPLHVLVSPRAHAVAHQEVFRQ